jgi:hypothetical protein
MLGSVVVLLVILLVCYVMAKGGVMLLNAGIKQEEEGSQASKDRMVQYSAWLKGKSGGFTRGQCLEKQHRAVVIFDPGNRRDILGTICMYCTDSMPTPDRYKCSDCSFTAVDGYILEDLCAQHKKEPVFS